MDNQPQVGQLDGDDLQLDVTVIEPDPFDAGIKVVGGRVAGVGSGFDHVQDVGGRRSGCLRADCANLMSCTPPLCRTNGSDASLRTGRACVWFGAAQGAGVLTPWRVHAAETLHPPQ